MRGTTLAQLREQREIARQEGITCFKGGIPGYYEWIDTHAKIRDAIKSIERLRLGLGPDIDIGVDFHAKTSPSVASIIVKETEPLNLLFIEEPCPPENVEACCGSPSGRPRRSRRANGWWLRMAAAS